MKTRQIVSALVGLILICAGSVSTYASGAGAQMHTLLLFDAFQPTDWNAQEWNGAGFLYRGGFTIIAMEFSTLQSDTAGIPSFENVIDYVYNQDLNVSNNPSSVRFVSYSTPQWTGPSLINIQMYDAASNIMVRVADGTPNGSHWTIQYAIAVYGIMPRASTAAKNTLY